MPGDTLSARGEPSMTVLHAGCFRGAGLLWRIPVEAALEIDALAKAARSPLAKFQYYARIEPALTVGTLVYPV
jgi:hypothetical protein